MYSMFIPVLNVIRHIMDVVVNANEQTHSQVEEVELWSLHLKVEVLEELCPAAQSLGPPATWTSSFHLLAAGHLVQVHLAGSQFSTAVLEGPDYTHAHYCRSLLYAPFALPPLPACLLHLSFGSQQINYYFTHCTIVCPHMC